MTLRQRYSKKYANGGGPCPNPPCDPIYTNNPKDPRLQAYNDSLNLYNYNVAQLSREGFKRMATPEEVDYASKQDYSKKDTGVYSDPDKYLQKFGDSMVNDNITWLQRYSSPDLKSKTIQPVNYYHAANGPINRSYKKPIQPVIYQKPQQQNKPTYADSMALYNKSQLAKKYAKNNDDRLYSLDLPMVGPKGIQPTDMIPNYGPFQADIPLYQKPVGTPTPQRKGKLSQNPSLRAYDMSTGARPNAPYLDKPQIGYDTSKPTKYSFTSPTGVGQNGQETMYMPTKGTLRELIKSKKGVSTQEGEDYMTTTGYKADGGSLSDSTARNNQALGIDSAMPELQAASSITTAMAGIAEAMDPPNQYGQQRGITNITKSTTKLGPVLGTLAGIVETNRQKREAKIQKTQEDGFYYNDSISRYGARAAADPTISRGVSGEELFEKGGSLSTMYAQKKLGSKGSLSKISSDTVEVKGPSHTNGGVDLNTGDEVEGGETIKGSYVLSQKNGFAQLHKPIAKAIGILEQKASSPATRNSLQRLRDKEDALILFQEEFNKQHNLK